MTDLYTKRHRINCELKNKKEELTKIISIDLDTGDAVLECGCKFQIHISKLITIV